MKSSKILFLFLFSLCFTGLFGDNYHFSSGRIDNPEHIQVLLAKDTPQVLLEVKGPYYIFNPTDGSRVSSGLLGKRFLVHAIKDGLKWGQSFIGIHQIYIVPRSEKTSILVDGVQYEGAVAIYKTDTNIQVVNDVSIENYIKSQMHPQFPYPMESEVLASLAIAYRTTAYYYATKNPSTFWHVDAKNVGYEGSAMVLKNSTVSKAVDATKHLIMVHPSDRKNTPFIALSTDHSAGKTAPYQTVFRIDAASPNKVVKAPHAALDRSESKWSFTLPKEKVAKYLGVKNIDSLELYIDEPSSKTYGMRIKDGDKFYDFNFLTLWEKLGKDRLLSSDFTATIKNNQIEFNGYGKGHGVGICLYTAAAMAQNGELAVNILSKFFPDTFLMNLSAMPNGEVSFFQGE